MNDMADAGRADQPAAGVAELPAAVTSEVMPALHFGARLAARREALGLSQGDIAERLRLHPRRIAALEAADLAALPMLTFVRGYLRNYARAVGLDAEPLLADLRERIEPSRADTPVGVPAPANVAPPPAVADAEPALRGPAMRSVAIAVVIGALVIFAVVGVIASRKSCAPAATTAPAAAPPAVAATTTSPDSERAAAVEPARSAPEEARQADKAAKAADAPAAVAGPTLRLAFRESAWVEVAQADGRVLLSQVNAPGTEQRFAGQPPYRLVIGNANTVSVTWRGRNIDLQAHTNFDNVARVTLD